MALSIGIRNSISFLSAIQATRPLTITLVGLSPTEHTSFILDTLPSSEFNVLRATFHPEGSRRWIVNWPEVERHLLSRAELDLGSAEDAVGTALLTEIRRYSSTPAAADSHSAFRFSDLLLPIHIRTGESDLRLFSTIMTLCRPQDVTLQELRVETWFPADQDSERCWQQSFGEGASQAYSASADGEHPLVR